MKNKIYIIIALIAVTVAVTTTVFAYSDELFFGNSLNSNETKDIEETATENKLPSVQTDNNAEVQTDNKTDDTVNHSDTITNDTPSQDDPTQIDTATQSEQVEINTASPTEYDSTNTPEVSESLYIQDRIDGTYWCNEYARYYGKYSDNAEYYKANEAYYKNYIPTLTFRQDGTVTFKIHTQGGMVEFEGVYSIDGAYISIELDLTDHPMGGFIPNTNYPYIDSRFLLEIIDYDTISFGVAPDAHYKEGCHWILVGDLFTRE